MVRRISLKLRHVSRAWNNIREQEAMQGFRGRVFLKTGTANAKALGMVGECTGGRVARLKEAEQRVARDIRSNKARSRFVLWAVVRTSAFTQCK